MPRWLMNALVETGTKEGYRAVVTTDAPCHLWLRWSRNKPQKHPRAKVVRGLLLMGDVYYCFTAYNDIEQEEAGDTTEHTFIMSDWPACETRWMYLWGTIAGAETPSESPIWGRHLYSDSFSTLLQISHISDDALLGLGNIWCCPTLCINNLCAGRGSVPAEKLGSLFRFQNIPIPRYSSVDSAYLIHIAYNDYAKIICRTQIWAEQEDNPPNYIGETFATAWTRKDNSGVKVNWDEIPPWTNDESYTSPNISAVIEQIVNRPGWEEGNALVLFWNDYAHRSSWEPWLIRCGHAYNHTPAKASYLSLNYTKWLLKGVNP